MKLRLDYGSDGLEASVPDDATVITPRHADALADPHASLIDALRDPIASRSLREVASNAGSIGISVCDFTRAQPRQQMLEAIFEELPGVSPDRFTIFVATGTHRANTETELRQMLAQG